MSNYHIFTIGDALVTFNPVKTGKLRYNTSFEQSLGGAELNFAIGCARLGIDATWLGNDEFGKYALAKARAENISTRYVELVDDYPTSIYFKQIQEDGSSQSFYYRQPTPLLALHPEHITKKMLEGINLVHLTGVFLAVAPKNIEIAVLICKLAVANNIPISFDPNVRLKLWSIEQACEAYAKLLPYVNILLTGSDELELIAPNLTPEEVASKYQLEQLVIKDGANGAKAYIAEEWTKSPSFNVKVIDTVGAGDGFDAGYIYGYLNGYSVKERLKFANAVGALVVSAKGDNEGLPELLDVEIFLGTKKIIER